MHPTAVFAFVGALFAVVPFATEAGWPGSGLPATGDSAALELPTGAAPDEPVFRRRTAQEWAERARGEGSSQERALAAWALGRFIRAGGTPVETLGRLLGDDDPRVRSAAAAALAELGHAERHRRSQARDLLPHLVTMAAEALSGDDRRNAVLAIGGLGPHAAPAVPVLAEVLRRDDAHRAAAAADALALIGPSAAEAIPALVAALGDADVYLRRAAAGALAAIGPDSVEPLGEALASPSEHTRRYAAEALGRIEPSPRAALERLLHDRDAAKRIGAARALGAGRPPDPAGAEPLLEVLSEPDPELRLEAVRSLGRTLRGRPEAIPRLLPLLDSDDAQLRFDTVRAMAAVGPAGVPALVEALRHDRPAVRAGAAAAVARLLMGGGPAEWRAAAPAVEPLVALLADAEAPVRYQAAEALGAIRSAAADGLLEVVATEDATVRQAAVYALGRMGLVGGRQVTAVLRAVRDPAPPVRREAVLAALALAEDPVTGTERAEFIAALTAAGIDPDPSVRYHAAKALARLDEAGRPEHLKAAAAISRAEVIAPYLGFEQDRERLTDTFYMEGARATGEAVAAAARLFRLAPMVGMTRDEAITFLGTPASSGATLVYSYDSGMGGVMFSLRLENDVVVELESFTHE